MPASPYSADFYAAQSEGSKLSAQVVLPMVWELVGSSTSVVDIGCGVGTWLSVCKTLGATRVLGLDGDYVDRKALLIDESEFRPTDFTDLSLPDPGVFDLAICMEVAEHLPEESASSLVKFIASRSSVVLFSAAIPGQGGTHHVNEQWPGYWIEKFEDLGFESFDVIRARVWDDDRVQSWYRQNTFVFAKGPSTKALRSAPLSSMPLNVVHPDKWKEATTDTPSLSAIARDVGALPFATASAAKKLMRRVGKR